MEALGRLFDLHPNIVPVDLAGGAATGKRLSLKKATGVAFVVFKGAASTGTDPVLTLQQHTASTSGTSSNLVACDHYYQKSAATLAGTETWTRVVNNSGTPSQTVTLTGESDKQGIYVVEINASSLADGYAYVSINTADAGSAAQVGGILAITHDLTVQRAPANLAATLG